MTSAQDIKNTPLDPRLFDEDDDGEDLKYKPIINDVITQTSTPLLGASQIDEWVKSEAFDRVRHVDGRELTADEKDRLWLVWPNPARQVDMIIGTVAKICSAYPPGHPSQIALVEFVQDLKRLPKSDVPGLSYNEENEPVLEGTFTLWPLGHEFDTTVKAQRFQREADDLAYPFSEVENLGSETQIRWRNLQSFIARITTLGLIDCSSVSALSNILPSSNTYPDLEERKVGGPSRIAADLIAASQWLLPDDSRKWVHEKCKAGAGEDWSVEKWKQWRDQMEFIEKDERFDAETRALATSVKQKMEAEE